MMKTDTPKAVVPDVYGELYNPAWRNIVLYGGRASGKSYNVAESLVFRGRGDKLRILCTREYQNTIKDSVHKLLSDIITKYNFTDYYVTNDSIRNNINGTEFIFRGLHNNVTEIKSLEGIDIAWIEEAQSITDSSLDILTPTIRKPGSQLIYTFNRLNELDPVYVRYVMNQPPSTYVSKINYDVMRDYGFLSDVTLEEIEHDKATNPGLYAHKWLGEPLGQAEMSIISRDAIMGAMTRSVEDDGITEIGVDVARMGNDRTVLWKRKGLKTTDTVVLEKKRTTEICDALEELADHDLTVLIKVDDTGVGGGVTDEMLKRGYKVLAINFGASAVDNDRYPNWISEAWFYLATIIDQIELPFEPDLLMELSTRQWGQDAKGKRRVEGKAEYKKRGFRSPDLADACIICYYTPIMPRVELGFF